LVFIISFSNFIKKTKNTAYLKKNYSKLKKQMEFIMEACDKDKLLVEDTMQNWSETIDKKGKVLFTNVLFYKALVEFSYLAKLINEKESYIELSQEVKKNINKLFWNGDYYIDWIYKNKRQNIFSTDGNISAILYDICSREQGEKIQKKIQEYKIEQPVPVKTNYPRYPWRNHFFINKFLLRDYHNCACKLWLGSLDAVAKNKIGMRHEAELELSEIARNIVKDKTVVEVYDSSGKPLKTFFYRAERNFGWSAGLFIWAVHQLYPKVIFP
jgi:hypothetical protein